MARTQGSKNKFKWTNDRRDGWKNTLTGIGTKNDKTTNTQFGGDKRLPHTELEQLYRSDGLTKKIVDLIPDEMTREWLYIEGDEDNKILSYMEDFHVKDKINRLLTWARLYGGAIAIIGADDGQTLDKELNEDNIKTIDFLHVFDRSLVTINTQDLYLDPTEKKYGMPKQYYVTPHLQGRPFYVHESRVLRLDGEKMPPRLQNSYDNWGLSVIETIYTELKDLGTMYGAARNIIDDFIQTIIKIEDLGQKIADGQDDYVKARMELMDLSRSTINTIFLDSGEDYQKQASNVAGLKDLLENFTLKLAAVSRVPYIVLSGQSPSGLQATGSSEIRMFYDFVAAEQNDTLLPKMERLVSLIIKSKDFDGKVAEDWRIQFNPLWQQSEKEKVDTRKVQAEIDSMYIDRGVLDPSEVSASRFGSGSFNIETTLDDETRNLANSNTEAETSDE